MKSFRLATSSMVRWANDRIRVTPAETFFAADCVWLVVLDDLLIRPDSGNQYRLETADCDPGEEQYLRGLVDGARQLCQGDDRSIGLLLPMAPFLYSHYSIQLGNEYLGSKDLVHSAIALQKDLLLPAMEQEFELGAAAGRSAGVAFWLPLPTMKGIEAAFSAAGLKLLAVMPRALAIGPEGGATDYVVADTDASTCSIIQVEEQVAVQVLSAARQEFDNTDIQRAWDEQATPLLSASPVSMATPGDWLQLSRRKRPLPDYLFFTRAFLESVSGRNQQRRALAGAVLAVAALFVLVLPLVYQWADALRLERARDAYRQQAEVAAAYQDAILDMEYEWGVVYEYPEADVAGILTTLNSVIRNSLTTFSLDETSIEIQGFTADPEQLTKLLVAQPLFQKIEQSRSISGSNLGGGDRFGLRLTLANHDYPGYLRKYAFK